MAMILRIMIGSQVAPFIHSGASMGFAISWPLTKVFQIIELVEGNHTLWGGVSFLSLNCRFQGYLLLPSSIVMSLKASTLSAGYSITLSVTTLMLMVICKLNMSSSYSTMLFVHSNFKQLEIMHFLLFWATEIHPVLEPSCVLDSSKSMAHSLSIHGPFGMIVLLLLLLLFLLLLLVQGTIHVSLPSVGKEGVLTACLVGLELAVQDNTPILFLGGSFQT